MRFTLSHDFVDTYIIVQGREDALPVTGEQVIISYAYGTMVMLSLGDEWTTVDAIGHQLPDAFVLTVIDSVYHKFEQGHSSVNYHYPAQFLSFNEPPEELSELTNR